jgi:hypothetical protein
MGGRSYQDDRFVIHSLSKGLDSSASSRVC